MHRPHTPTVHEADGQLNKAASSSPLPVPTASSNKNKAILLIGGASTVAIILLIIGLIFVGSGGKDSQIKENWELYKSGMAASDAEKYAEADEKLNAALKDIDSLIEKYPDEKVLKARKSLIEIGISTNSGFKNLDKMKN